MHHTRAQMTRHLRRSLSYFKSQNRLSKSSPSEIIIRDLGRKKNFDIKIFRCIKKCSEPYYKFQLILKLFERHTWAYRNYVLTQQNNFCVFCTGQELFFAFKKFQLEQ